MSIIIHPKDKDDALALQWLQKGIYHQKNGLSPCSNLAIAYIHKRDDIAEASNGFMLLRIKCPQCLENELTLINEGKALSQAARPSVATLPEEELKYPDTDKIVPKSNPLFQIAVNPQLLIKTLQMPQEKGWVTMSFYGRRRPMMVTGDKPANAIAVLMPMNLEKQVSTYEAVLEWIEKYEPQVFQEAREAVFGKEKENDDQVKST